MPTDRPSIEEFERMVEESTAEEETEASTETTSDQSTAPDQTDPTVDKTSMENPTRQELDQMAAEAAAKPDSQPERDTQQSDSKPEPEPSGSSSIADTVQEAVQDAEESVKKSQPSGSGSSGGSSGGSSIVDTVEEQVQDAEEAIEKSQSSDDGSGGGSSGPPSIVDEAEEQVQEAKEAVKETQEEKGTTKPETNQDSGAQSGTTEEKPTKDTAPEEEIKRNPAIKHEKEFDVDRVSEQTGIDEGRLRAGPSGEFSPELTAQAIARSELDSETPVDLLESDFTIRDGQAVLRPEVQRLVAAERAQSEVPVDLSASDFEFQDGQIGIREEKQRKIAAQRIDEQIPIDVSVEDVALQDGRAALREPAQRELAARRIDEQTTIDVTASRVKREDGQFTLADDALRKEAAVSIEQQQEADQKALKELRAEVQSKGLRLRGNAGVEPVSVEAEDVKLTSTGKVDEIETQRNLAVKRFDEKLNRDIDTDDVVISPAAGPVLREETRTEIVREQVSENIKQRFGVEPAADNIEVGQGDKVQLSESLRKDIVAQQFESETDANVERGEDFSVAFRSQEEQQFRQRIDRLPGLTADTGEIDIELEASGRRAVTIEEIEDRGEIEVGDDTVAITDASEQLQFDDEGRVTGVENPPDSFSEQAIDFASDVGGAAVEKASVVSDPALDVFSNVESAVSGPADAATPEPVETGLEFAFGARAGIEGAKAIADSPIGAAAETRLSLIQARSRVAQQTVIEDVVGPAAENVPLVTTGLGPGAEVAGVQDPDVATGEAKTSAIEGVGRSTATFTVGLPNTAIQSGRQATQAGQFTTEQIDEEGVVSGSATVATAGGGVAATTAANLTRQAERDPTGTGTELLTGAVIGTAITPVRFAKFKVPRTKAGTVIPRVRGPEVDAEAPKIDTGDVSVSERVPGTTQRTVDIERPRVQESGSVAITGPKLERPDTTTVRGVRITTPLIARGKVDFPGKTVAGFKGFQPTRGTPRIDADTVDFSRLEGKGATTEPVGRFETDVMREVAKSAGPQASARFGAAEGLVKVGSKVDTELELTKTQEIVKQAEAVPDERAADIATTLKDIDATIFGSAAIRSQIPEARTPRDVDIMVDDPAQAQRALQKTLEGTDSDVNDVFDIKDRSERATPGEIVKFGRLAKDRLETEEGVKITAVGEELIRKAGASAFIRGRGSPSSEFPGRTADVDVGPEPVSEGAFIRAKDPGDAAVISASLIQSDQITRLRPLRRRRIQRQVRQFEMQFRPEIERSLSEPPEFERQTLTTTTRDIPAFIKDDTAEVGFGTTRGLRETKADADQVGTQERRLIDDDRTGDVDSAIQSSPVRATNFNRTVPISGGRVNQPSSATPRLDAETRASLLSSDIANTQTSVVTQPTDFNSAAKISDVESSPAKRSRINSVASAGSLDSPSLNGAVKDIGSPGGVESPGGPTSPNIVTSPISSPGADAPASPAPSPGFDFPTFDVPAQQPVDSGFESGRRARAFAGSDFTKQFTARVASADTVFEFQGPVDEDKELKSVSGPTETGISQFSSTLTGTQGELSEQQENVLREKDLI